MSPAKIKIAFLSFGLSLTFFQPGIVLPTAVLAAQLEAETVAADLPKYEDESVEASLNNGDYEAALSLTQRRVKEAGKAAGLKEAGKAAGLKEAYYHVALFEAYLWAGRMGDGQNECKKAQTMIDALLAKAGGGEKLALLELKTRLLDAQSWLFEAIGQDAKCRAVLDEAIKMLKEQRELDRQTWRLSDALAHKASLDAQIGDYAQAKALLEEAIKYSKGSQSISNYSVADLEETLGGVLFKMGQSPEAQAHFARAVDIKKESPALLRRFAPHAYWLSPTYRYIKGAPWSSENFIGGSEHRTVDVGTAVLEAYLVRDKAASNRCVRVGVDVLNRSDSPLQFMPRKPELFVLNPKLALGVALDAGNLAQNVETKTAKKAESIRQDGRNAKQTITTYYPNPYPWNNNNGRGRQGFFRSLLSDAGNTGYTQIPDQQAEAQAMVKAQKVEEDGAALADEIRKEGIGPCEIAPRSRLKGFVFFEIKAPKNASLVMFKLPIGDAQFEVRFDRLP